MYGLILTNLSEYIISVYGEEKWETIRKSAGCAQSSFGIHQVYPDGLIPKLGAKACKILEITEREMYEGMGKFFVTFVGQFGYERVLSVLGRHFRDFINNLDNLHEYLRFSYARMKPPSFFCEKEDENGLTLHYRSKRRGFIWYVFGQIKEVSVHFYGTEIEMELINEEYLFDTVHVVFRLKFDNKAFIENEEMLADHKEIYDPVSGDMFLEIFPFSMVFGEDLVIKTIGKSLAAVLQQTVNRKLTDVFDMIKPLIECSWNTILLHTNNIFELVTIEPILIDESVPDEDDNTSYTGEDLCLHLKGQMIYVQDWDSLVFLGTPVMPNLDILMKSGLFINDLSMHDFSRDLVLAGQQQAAELKLALDQEKTKSRQLHESMKKLDMERERTDLLLYQMIPRQIADRLRKGENSENICEYFDSVTILFSDVVGFTSICSRISPMEVVSMLNGMYSLFDQLTERHKVYKVETIGDAYMVVSGAPTPNDKHAEDICNMALDMVILIEDLKDPSTDEGLKIRVGIHSGAVAAGVVGMKMPRYCLFGDSVNTASKMESSSEKLKIHITEYTKYLLDPSEWIIKERGSITVKGKGKVKTYWLVNSKLERPDPHEGLIMNEEVPDSPTENDRNTESRLSLYTPAIQQIRVVSSTDKEASSISLQNDTVKKDHSNGNNNPNITISEVDTKEDQSIMRSASSSSIFKSSENSKLFKNRSPNTSNKVTPIGSPDNTKNLTEPNLNRVPPTIIKTSDQDDNTSNGDAVNGSKPSLNGKKHVTISGSADKLLKEEAEKMEENFGNPPVVVTESKCLGGKNSSFCALL